MTTSSTFVVKRVQHIFRIKMERLCFASLFTLTCGSVSLSDCAIFSIRVLYQNICLVYYIAVRLILLRSLALKLVAYAAIFYFLSSPF